MDTQTEKAHITTAWAVDYCQNMTLSFWANYPETEVGLVLFCRPSLGGQAQRCFAQQSSNVVIKPGVESHILDHRSHALCADPVDSTLALSWQECSNDTELCVSTLWRHPAVQNDLVPCTEVCGARLVNSCSCTLR